MTADMLIHDDVDDESTLDDEEAQDEGDDEEIDDLQKVTNRIIHVHVYRRIAYMTAGQAMVAAVYWEWGN